MVFAGIVIGAILAVPLAAAVWWIEAWWERDCATVERQGAMGGSICLSCGRVVGWKHRRSCELA